MSVEYWINAERFYEFWFIVLSIAIFLIMMALLYIWMYVKKEKRKTYTVAALGLVLLLAGIGAAGHLRYQPYLEEAGRINPLIRDREPTMAGYTYYGLYERNFFSQLNDLESLRKISLYEEEQVKEPVTYLGKGDYFYYFERADGEIFKQGSKVTFEENVQGAHMVGSRFRLIDESFQGIGFQNPEAVMFDYIEVPASQKEKQFEPEYDPDVPTADDRFGQWNF